MNFNTLPASFKICATCSLWAGTRSTDALRTYSIFDMDKKGECCGGGFNFAQMHPMATCNQWQKWPLLKS